MIVVKLMGGMGNQMFQYAFGLNIARKTNSALKFDLNFLLDRSSRENFVFRDFDLEIFTISEKNKIDPKEQAYYSGTPSGHFLKDLTVKLRRKIKRPYHLIDYSM